MAKRGQLTKVEKHYIEGNVNLPIEDLAKDLDRTVNIIQKYINTLDLPKETPKPKITQVKKQDPKMLALMGRKKRGDENVATVMTPAASELADATRHQRLGGKKIQEAIHKPRG